MFSDPLSRMAVLLALITFLVSTITGVEMTRKEPYQLEKFALQGFMLFNKRSRLHILMKIGRD